MILLTETWLTNDISTSEIFSNNYLVFRKDRNLQEHGVTRGGGVLLAVNAHFHVTHLDLSFLTQEIPQIDIVGVKLISQNVFIFVLYIPPSISLYDFELFFEIFNVKSQLFSF